MTTIVYRDGILAADTQMTEGEFILPMPCHKLTRVERADGSISLIGATGSMLYMKELEEWVISEPRIGPQPVNDKADSGIVLEVVWRPGGSDQRGKVQINSYSGDTGLFWSAEWKYTFRDGYFATGAGAAYAYGALGTGASADQAVRVAARFDTYTNSDIDTINFWSETS